MFEILLLLCLKSWSLIATSLIFWAYWSYSDGDSMHIASEISSVGAGSLKAAQEVLLLSSSKRGNSVKQSSGLQSENESYTWHQMVYFLVKITGEQGTRLILCFSIFNQLQLHPVSTDINSYSLEWVMHLSERQMSALLCLFLWTVSAAPSRPRSIATFSVCSLREEEPSIASSYCQTSCVTWNSVIHEPLPFGWTASLLHYMFLLICVGCLNHSAVRFFIQML